MIKRDYYEVLSISRDADSVEIKKAYRQMAMKYHPDRNQGNHEAEEFFKEASEAYEVLCDPQKRQVYDNYGHQGLEGTGFSGFSGMDDINSSFSDLFEEFFSGFGDFGFGGRRSSSRPKRGRDLAKEIVISFDEAVFGTQKEIQLNKAMKCDDCEGSGLEPGTTRETCHECGGTGKITHRQGFFVMQSACGKCGGRGSTISHPCKQCKGKGRIAKEKVLNVKVPAGVEDGTRLVLRGEGEVGYDSGPPGDMYVLIGVRPHKEFKRHGNDIYYRLEMGFPQAALGVEVEVPTMYGVEKVAVPAGSNTGDLLKLKGKGVPDVRTGKKGNHLVEILLKTPKKLSKKQKKLLEDFIKESK